MNFAVFVSEDCGALREILEGCREYRIQGRVSVVIGDRGDGKPLQLARDERIPAYIFAVENSEDLFCELSEILQLYHADALILTDSRRSLSPQIVSRYSGRIFYIVHAPSAEFIGSDRDEYYIHDQMISEGLRESALTVFRVTEGETASVVAQKKIRIYAEDSSETLAQRMRFFEPELVGRFVADLADRKL